MRLHAEYAWLPGAAEPSRDVLIEVADGRFGAVTAGVPAPAGARRLPGLTLPGLANAHSHAFHRALRGRTHGGRGDFWSWREQMYAVADRLDPDSATWRWPARSTPRWRWPASPASASSTTCTTTATAAATPTRTR